MHKITKLFSLAILGLGLANAAMPTPAQAEMKMKGPGNFMKKGMHISAPWTSPTTAADKSAAVFMTVMNHRRDDVVLLEIKTPIAAKAIIHSVVTKDGEPVMEAMTKGLPLAKHQIVRMEPGGMHVMLMGIKEPLKDGAEIPMTLVFDKAGPIDIQVKVSKTITAPRGSHKGDMKNSRGSHKK